MQESAGPGTTLAWCGYQRTPELRKHRDSYPKCSNSLKSTAQRGCRPRDKEKLDPLLSYIYLFIPGWTWKCPVGIQKWRQGNRIEYHKQDSGVQNTFFCWRIQLLLKCTVPKYPAIRACESPHRQISSIKDNNLLFLATWSLGKANRTNESFCTFIIPTPNSHKGTMTRIEISVHFTAKKKKTRKIKIVVHKSNFFFCTIYSLCRKLTWWFKPSDALLHLYLLHRKLLTRSQSCEFSWGWIRCSHCHGWEVADNVIYTDWKTTSEEKTE